MKLFLFILLFSSSAFSMHHGSFDKNKKHLIKVMKERKKKTPKIIDKAIKCVERASNKKALQTCLDKRDAKFKALPK